MEQSKEGGSPDYKDLGYTPKICPFMGISHYFMLCRPLIPKCVNTIIPIPSHLPIINMLSTASWLNAMEG